jgi:adenosylcobinamide-phosphate synthase
MDRRRFLWSGVVNERRYADEVVTSYRCGARAVGLLVGAAVDRIFGDPRRFHPVAGFGAVAANLERRDHRDSRAVGAVHVAVLVGGAVALGIVIEKCSGKAPFAVRVGTTALATFAVLGGRSLQREALTISQQLTARDLSAARSQITHLVGRDPSNLDAAQIIRATVESVAENTADAVVSPLFWGAVAGIPGLLGYRAANTLDAMIGHRSARYLNFGWAAARFDDLLNFLPARACVALVALCAPGVGGRAGNAVRSARRDGPHHPSPNAGPVEAAFAGALDRTLGGLNVYEGRVEDRGTLGDGPRPDLVDIRRVARLSAQVSAAAAVLAAGLARRPRSGRQRRGSARPAQC